MRGIFIVFSMLCSTITIGQNTDLIEKLTSSDSIVAISHQTLETYRYLNCDSLGNYIPAYSLLKDGDIHPDVVVKKVLLNKDQIKVLTLALVSEAKISIIGECYDPHHSILMYKNGELTYLDICFDCRNFHYSVNSAELIISPLNWTNLTSFMNSLGLIREDLNYDGDSVPTRDCREFLPK